MKIHYYRSHFIHRAHDVNDVCVPVLLHFQVKSRTIFSHVTRTAQRKKQQHLFCRKWQTTNNTRQFTCMKMHRFFILHDSCIPLHVMKLKLWRRFRYAIFRGIEFGCFTR